MDKCELDECWESVRAVCRSDGGWGVLTIRQRDLLYRLMGEIGQHNYNEWFWAASLSSGCLKVYDE
jgi:hypothetical protein